MKNKIVHSIDQKTIDARHTNTYLSKFSLDEHRNRRRNCFFGNVTIGSPRISDGNTMSRGQTWSFSKRSTALIWPTVQNIHFKRYPFAG